MAQAWSPEQMEALALLQEGMRRVYADEDPALILDWLHGQTGKAPATPDDVLRWGESFAFYDQVLADRALRSLLPPEQRKEISFPWKSYNTHIDTPDEGMLMLLGAGPGSGKTIKGEMVLEHNAKHGLRSGLYNFELNRTVMLDRRAVRHAQYDRRSFKQGLLTEAQILQLDEETPLWMKPEDRQGLGDWQKLSRQLRKALDEANERMKGWAGAIDYWFTPGWDIDKLCATIYAEHMQNPYDLVAVDYLEKIQPSARQRKLFGTNKLDREEDNVEQLKTLAEKLRIPILVLSQLSKAGRAKNAEDMDGTEVRGAGAKTERSNINVLFSIDKGDDSVPDPSIKDGVMLSVAITKNTMGSCGTFRMFRNGARFTIHDTTKQELDA